MLSSRVVTGHMWPFELFPQSHGAGQQYKYMPRSRKEVVMNSGEDTGKVIPHSALVGMQTFMKISVANAQKSISTI